MAPVAAGIICHGKMCKSTRRPHCRLRKRRYERRNRIEIMFGRLKNWRRVATRYARCPEPFLSAIMFPATVLFWL